MKYEIKKIDIWTVARYTGLFYGLVGLIPMVFGLVAFLSRVLSRGFDLEILAFVLFPLGFFVAGFIAGLVFALIYNWAAERWGGIKMEIEYNQDK